jgi:hypothetical protein
MVVHAVIYIRVSTEEQALQGYSIEAQVEEVKAKCRQESRKFPATMTYIGASDVTPKTFVNSTVDSPTGMSHVVYCITSKPPAMIEWE